MDQLVSFIIRPPRAEYNPKEDLLDQEFMLKEQWFQRKDLEVTNSRGHKLQCSHYTPLVVPNGSVLPCVIYCHGNSGCRADASEAAIILLPSYITVFSLDFSGSGLSEGEHVTLGWNEKDDLDVVVKHLRAAGDVSRIGLWGRSMGAVTSLLYGAEDPSIAGMVLDSPFCDLVELMNELVDTYKFRLPKFTVKYAIQYMRKLIQKKAKFDILELNSIKAASSCFVPVLMGHAIDDDFIRPHHSEKIYNAYVGDKNIIKFEGDHNSPRPQFYFDSITIFFHNILQPPKEAIEGNYFGRVQNYSLKDSWETSHDIEYANQRYVEASKDTSTEESINNLRSRRHMSRMEVPSSDTCVDKDSIPGGEQETDPISSSGSHNFEISHKHPELPLVPTTIDEDQYVEYPLEDLSDFPCNTEEEERMFMEAVIESLRDFEMRHPSEDEQLLSDRESSILEHRGPSKIDGSSSSGTDDTHDLSHEHELTDTTLATGHPFDTPPTLLNSTSKDTSANITTKSTACISTEDDDCAGGTRAILTVQRNPPNHIVDGLLHRWGLNFFKNT